MKVNERRRLMIELLSDVRQTSREYLAKYFKTSLSTVDRDIIALSCEYPVTTVQGNGGGVRVADGWYISRRYLHQDQEEFLRSLIPGLQPEGREMMKSILQGFAKPKID